MSMKTEARVMPRRPRETKGRQLSHQEQGKRHRTDSFSRPFEGGSLPANLIVSVQPPPFLRGNTFLLFEAIHSVVFVLAVLADSSRRRRATRRSRTWQTQGRRLWRKQGSWEAPREGAGSFTRGGQEGLSDRAGLEQRPGGGKGGSHVGIRERSIGARRRGR